MFLFDQSPNPLPQPGKSKSADCFSPGCWQLLIAITLTGAVLVSKDGVFKCSAPRSEASMANAVLGVACTWLPLPLKTWSQLQMPRFSANLKACSCSHCNQWWRSDWFNGGRHTDLIRKLVAARKEENAQQPARSLVGSKQRSQLSLRDFRLSLKKKKR